MGLSIHYNGRLKAANSLMDLIEEVQSVAKAHTWEFQVLESVFPDDKFSKETEFDKFYGINFTPTDCETISIAFLSNGRMVCPARVHFFADSKKEEERDWIYTISVKTQYAGIKTHQVIILFFKYLAEKYFENFEMLDESGYWETNDEKKMKAQFQKYEMLIANFSLAIETLPIQKNEDLIAYLERMMKKVNDLQKGEQSKE